jgi:hypothetical protein
MRNFSSDDIQKAAEEVKKSEHEDLMFRDPGHKRRTRHKRSSGRKHKLPKSLHRITSRHKKSRRPTTSTRKTSRKQKTSRRNTSRRNTSRNHQTSMVITSRRNTSRQQNTFRWGIPRPIRGRFCCNQSQRNHFRLNTLG